MIDILNNIVFQIFFITLIAILLNIFLKMLSKDDKQKPLELRDLSIGYELSITSLIFFINDYLIEVSSLNNYYEIGIKFIYAPFIIIIFILLLTILTYFTRKKGWKSDSEMKPIAIIFQNIFGVTSLVLVFIWMKF